MARFLKKEHDTEESDCGKEQKRRARKQNVTTIKCKKREII